MADQGQYFNEQKGDRMSKESLVQKKIIKLVRASEELFDLLEEVCVPGENKTQAEIKVKEFFMWANQGIMEELLSKPDKKEEGKKDARGH